jgi:hypothetical protein
MTEELIAQWRYIQTTGKTPAISENKKQYRLIVIQRKIGLIWVMVFNVTFNNILSISWRSLLLVEEIGVP